MPDPVTTPSDSAVEGATPAKTPDTTQQAAPSDSATDTTALHSALMKERAERKALEKRLREIERTTDDAARKTAEEQGAFKSLYETERAKREATEKAIEEANARYREAQTSSALASALGAHVAEGSSPHVMAALSAALTVGDDGKVDVDMTRVNSIRSAKPLDTTKIKDVSTLVSAFLEANPFFAASKTAGGAGSGGIGLVNGSTNYQAIWANWPNYTEDQRNAFIADPGFKKAVLG